MTFPRCMEEACKWPSWVWIVIVVGMVAVPARREGRDVLTDRGEAVVGALKDRTEAAIPRRDRAGAAS